VVPNQRIFGLLSSRLLPTKVAILLKNIILREKDEIIGLASFNNLADIPVAFLTLVLFICLCRNSSDISLSSRLGLSFFIFVKIKQ
jgi:hypothetical protein